MIDGPFKLFVSFRTPNDAKYLLCVASSMQTSISTHPSGNSLDAS